MAKTGKPWNGKAMAAPARQPRFLTLADVAEILSTSTAQVYALVRRKELRGIQIGGRGQWRVETSELERYIERMYERTDAMAAVADDGTSDDGPVDEGGADQGSRHSADSWA